MGLLLIFSMVFYCTNGVIISSNGIITTLIIINNEQNHSFSHSISSYFLSTDCFLFYSGNTIFSLKRLTMEKTHRAVIAVHCGYMLPWVRIYQTCRWGCEQAACNCSLGCSGHRQKMAGLRWILKDELTNRS